MEQNVKININIQRIILLTIITTIISVLSCSFLYVIMRDGRRNEIQKMKYMEMAEEIQQLAFLPAAETGVQAERQIKIDAMKLSAQERKEGYIEKQEAARLAAQAEREAREAEEAAAAAAQAVPVEEAIYYEPEVNWNAVPSAEGQSIASLASQYAGITPYVPAGRSLVYGTDCSGFVSLIYGEFGIYVSPCSSDYQYCPESFGGTFISYEQLQPGDVVVYYYGGHVGIYLGGDTIVHAANPSDGTYICSMWFDQPTAYVRIGG